MSPFYVRYIERACPLPRAPALVPTSSIQSLSPSTSDLWLILVIVVGFALRWQYVHLPMAEAHSWRQITNADIARNFTEESANILYPQVSWGGPKDAYVSMEFPLLQWLAGMLFHVVRDREFVCRILSILFSMGALVATYASAPGCSARRRDAQRRFFWRSRRRSCSSAERSSPTRRWSSSRSPRIWGLVAYAQTHDRRAAWWGIASATLACMVKIPAVLIFAPIAWLAWSDVPDTDAGHVERAAQRACSRAVQPDSGSPPIGIPFVGTALWYWHGDRLFHRTGLGQAIFHPSGGYSPDVAIAMGPVMGVSHWSTLHQLGDPAFYSTILDADVLHAPDAGRVRADALRARRLLGAPGLAVVVVWLAAVLLFILASAEGNRYHEFHQLPMLPPAALLFGLAAFPAFDGAWLRRITGSRLVPIASALAVTVDRPDRLFVQQCRPRLLPARPARPALDQRRTRDRTPRARRATRSSSSSIRSTARTRRFCSTERTGKGGAST